eukprot:CAMPEP_0197427192 /NCGR_PEP_ID=MMETSP1170-20131217/37540_1 /TAXON_ID=54406 /ORGANISM="Sarcinochrysis sp, Strain CCMP770" /LENGTH=157 /DNA_ID=CAMNT_0042954869 /DNA_START=194 /DNA_END=663 /DNA_ORIENTATION=-
MSEEDGVPLLFLVEVGEVQGLEGEGNEVAFVGVGEDVGELGAGGVGVDGALEGRGKREVVGEDDDVGGENGGGGVGVVEVGEGGVELVEDVLGRRTRGVVVAGGLAEFDEERRAGSTVADEAATLEVLGAGAKEGGFDLEGVEHLARAEDDHAVEAG